MVARALVTTAIEETWPEDKNEPVLFLGCWCKLYSRKFIWENINSNTESYHWNDREKLHADYLYLQELHEHLVVELATKLNELHSVNHSVRYWRILIGPWLGCLVQMLFDRWFMLKQAIDKSDVTVCKIIKRNLTDCVPNDMENFINIYIEDDWNEAVYGQLLEKCWPESILIKKVRLQKVDKSKPIVARRGLKFRLKSIIKRWAVYFNTLLPSENKYFFISTYLPPKMEARLQICFGQFPRFWNTPPVPVIPPVQSERAWKLDKHKAALNSFEEVARYMIPIHIPTAYLEGYKKLIEMTRRLPWGHNPKAIFTSNAYFPNDFFKAWAAEKIELQVPLIIGQHGGHFGMTPFSFHEKHQIEIADKWLSWGWSDPSDPKILPIGIFKDFDESVAHNPKGGALMVEMSIPRYSYHMYAAPISSQWLDYYNEQILFVKKLPEEIQKRLTVRLYGQDYDWNQKERWGEDLPDIKLDNGIENIKSLIKDSRLYISTYNATTYLEALTLNIPTVIFWNCNHWELKEEVKPYFDLLESVGIFHKTPESVAIQVEKIWNDIPSWWESSPVQEARLLFCEKFSHKNKNLLNEMKFLLNRTLKKRK